MTSIETVGRTKLRSAHDRVALKRRKAMSNKAVPSQIVGLPIAWKKGTSKPASPIPLAEPICFIPLLRNTFPVAWDSMEMVNTIYVFTEVPHHEKALR